MDSLWGELCNSRACTRKATHMLLIFWEQIYNGFTSQAPGKSTWKPTWQGTGPSGTALLHPYLCPEHGIAGTKMSATHHIACAVAAQTRARTLQLLKIA
jgi:hypothetical protein